MLLFAAEVRYQIDYLFESYVFYSCLFPSPCPPYDEVDDNYGRVTHQLSPNSLSVPRAQPLCVLLCIPDLTVKACVLYDRNALLR
jgi:hypothetical protein